MIGEDLNMAVPFEKMSSISEIHRVAASTLCPGGELIKVDGRASDCLVCILSGATEYDFGFKVERAEAGELLYLARGSVYTMNVLEEYSVIFADFDFSTGDERAGAAGGMDCLPDELCGAAHLFRSVKGEGKAPPAERARKNPAGY